jgi:hypothetical protein
MTVDFKLGCHRLTFHPRENISIDREFELIKQSGVFDYVDWLPRPDILDECISCSEKYDLPILTGTFQYMLGRDEAMLEQDMRNAVRAGVKVHNVMIYARRGDGSEVTNDEIVSCYLKTLEFGDKIGLQPSFEVHINMWSEQYPRILEVADAVKRAGAPFWFTLDYSHCIFKIENPPELDISGVRDEVEGGRLILDPFDKNSLCEQWLNRNMVVFAQFRPVSPNGPVNVWARDERGQHGRGVQYPFIKPRDGEFHSPWQAYRLEPSKEAIRKVMRYHLTHPESPLRYINTEMINLTDYGENAGYSIFENNIACARWLRATWSQLKAMHACGIPLEPTLS